MTSDLGVLFVVELSLVLVEDLRVVVSCRSEVSVISGSFVVNSISSMKINTIIYSVQVMNIYINYSGLHWVFGYNSAHITLK